MANVFLEISMIEVALAICSVLSAPFLRPGSGAFRDLIWPD
jgi:hypothetical protein